MTRPVRWSLVAAAAGIALLAGWIIGTVALVDVTEELERGGWWDDRPSVMPRRTR